MAGRWLPNCNPYCLPTDRSCESLRGTSYICSHHDHRIAHIRAKGSRWHHRPNRNSRPLRTTARSERETLQDLSAGLWYISRLPFIQKQLISPLRIEPQTPAQPFHLRPHPHQDIASTTHPLHLSTAVVCMCQIFNARRSHTSSQLLGLGRCHQTS